RTRASRGIRSAASATSRPRTGGRKPRSSCLVVVLDLRPVDVDFSLGGFRDGDVEGVPAHLPEVVDANLWADLAEADPRVVAPLVVIVDPFATGRGLVPGTLREVRATPGRRLVERVGPGAERVLAVENRADSAIRTLHVVLDHDQRVRGLPPSVNATPVV